MRIHSKIEESDPWAATDVDWSLHYSRIDGLSSVINSNLNSSISVFPNPTSGVLNIVTIAKGNAPQSYTLKSAQGAIMQQELLLANQSTINISNIPSGVYILELMVGNEKHFRKIVKN